MAKEDGARRIGQEGSRWYNEPPSGKELADWFKENVDLHKGLTPDNYVQGVTLIPGVEKAQTVVGWDSNDHPLIQKRENLVYTPYAKVETRIKYFHDLMALKEEEWLGVIEPVPTEHQDPRLPPGFFAFSIATGAETVVRYICCSMKVTVFKRNTVKWHEWRDTKTGEMKRTRTGETIIDAAPATKMVATLAYQERPDSFALMKAETGAIGRALGLAGMLVIPGTGVATAEDLQEAAALEGRSPSATPAEDTAEGAVPPADGGAPSEQEALTDLRQEAVLVVNTFKTEFPEDFKSFVGWAQERKIGEIGKIEDPRILRGIITKANRDLAAAREAAPPAESKQD